MSGCKYCKETKQESFEYQKHQLEIYKVLKEEQDRWTYNFQGTYLQALSVLIIAPLGILWTLWTNADKLSLETIYFVIEMVLIWIVGFGSSATSKAGLTLRIKFYSRCETLQTCLKNPKLSLKDLLTKEEKNNQRRMNSKPPFKKGEKQTINQTSMMLYQKWISDFIIVPIFIMAVFFLPLVAWLKLNTDLNTALTMFVINSLIVTTIFIANTLHMTTNKPFFLGAYLLILTPIIIKLELLNATGSGWTLWLGLACSLTFFILSSPFIFEKIWGILTNFKEIKKFIGSIKEYPFIRLLEPKILWFMTFLVSYVLITMLVFNTPLGGNKLDGCITYIKIAMSVCGSIFPYFLILKNFPSIKECLSKSLILVCLFSFFLSNSYFITDKLTLVILFVIMWFILLCYFAFKANSNKKVAFAILCLFCVSSLIAFFIFSNEIVELLVGKGLFEMTNDEWKDFIEAIKEVLNIIFDFTTEKSQNLL
ncbi:hypothetical protein [Helicobacter cetorum]|uniref:hypothetical protein n=1 Tax=Helicobacter cetorum TaxID=138563 RepID=UPI000CF153E6|nr:hypothetical protein [Helicobacter cetorum]